MKKIVSTALAVSFGLSSISCAMSDKTKRLLMSTGIGCAAGLAIGAAYDEKMRAKDSKDRTKNLQNQIGSVFKTRKAQDRGKIVGLAGGCLAGLGTGFYLNTMYDDMETTLGKDGIGLEKVTSRSGGEPEALKVKMDGGISFEDGKADLKGKGKENLQKIAEAMAGYPETKIDISGHANRTGSEPQNVSLSLSRASSARQSLIDAGIDPTRIGKIEGLGSSSPLAGVDPKDGQNRRVEILIVPKG